MESLLYSAAVGWAKAQRAVPISLAPCSRWWARFRLRSLSYGGRGRFVHPTNLGTARSFRRLALGAGQHALKPFAHDRFGVADDAGDELGAGGDVVDQPLHLARRPDALIGIACGIDHLAAGAGDELADVLELGAF